MTDEWERELGETPEQYAERLGGRKSSNMSVMRGLERHFGLGRAEAKATSLQARSYWEAFYEKHAREIHSNDGSRDGAVTYIKRKNDPWDIGKPVFTDDEIDALVDSVGEWKR